MSSETLIEQYFTGPELLRRAYDHRDLEKELALVELSHRLNG